MSSVDTTEEVVGEVVSIEGVVKWFDPVKGYGFIVPNDGGVDVLVHHSTLRRGGYDILYPQACVSNAPLFSGSAVDKIIVDNSEAIIPTGNPRPILCLTSPMCLISSRPRKYDCAASVSLMSSQTGKIFSEVLRKAGIEALVPEPFRLRFACRRGPLTTHNGPWFHWDERDSDQCAEIRSRHATQLRRGPSRFACWNAIVTVAVLSHGGFLSSFADGLAATAVFREVKRSSVTIKLNTEF